MGHWRSCPGREVGPWQRLAGKLWLPHPGQCSRPGWMGLAEPGLEEMSLPVAGVGLGGRHRVLQSTHCSSVSHSGF